MQIIGLTIEELIHTLSKKMVIDIVPKYTFEQNLVSLNHVFVENNVGYSFRVNFPLKYKVLNLTDNDDSGLSDFDKLAINMTKQNESVMLINKNNIKSTIKRIKSEKSLKASKNEIEFYQSNFTVNKLQKNFLFLFWAKEFSGAMNLYSCNLREYITLLVLMKKYLVQKGFILLPIILSAKNSKNNEKKVLNKKNLMRILESPKYQNLIKTKYSYSSAKIFESGQIVQDIATILSNKFTYCDYKGKRNDKEIEINTDLLIEEMLRFAEMI